MFSTGFSILSTHPINPQVGWTTTARASWTNLVPTASRWWPKRPDNNGRNSAQRRRSPTKRQLGSIFRIHSCCVPSAYGVGWIMSSGCERTLLVRRFSEAWVKAKAKYGKDLEDFKAAGGVILKPEKRTRVKRAAWRETSCVQPNFIPPQKNEQCKKLVMRIHEVSPWSVNLCKPLSRSIA